jgi:hypothetical protein
MLAILMSVRMVLRMKVRRAEDVVRGRRGKSVLSNLEQVQFDFILESLILFFGRWVGTAKCERSLLDRRYDAFVFEHDEVLYKYVAHVW